MKINKKVLFFRILAYGLMSYGLLSFLLSKVLEESLTMTESIINLVLIITGYTINGVISYSLRIDKVK